MESGSQCTTLIYQRGQKKKMARLNLVLTPSDFPGAPSQATAADLDELFADMFPGNPDPRIDNSHLAMGVLARDPRLAIHFLHTTRHIAKVLPWVSQRPELRELAIQSLNLHFNSEYSFRVRIPYWTGAGLSLELLDQLPNWRSSSDFSQEQRLVIAYTLSVVAGDVPTILWDQVVDQYGEQGALEFTIAVGWWSFWAMLVNATGIQHDFDAA